MTFKEAYKLPFHEYLDWMYVLSANGTKVFTAFSPAAKGILRNIVNILNGEGTTPKYDRKFIKVDRDMILINGETILVRGWGKLTGCGGFGLKREEAARIQDEFISWVISQISEDVSDFESPLGE